MTYSSLVAGDVHNAQLVVVFLHGHGMTAEELAPFAAALGPGVAVHFLLAPFDAIGAGRAWWPRDPCFSGLRGAPPWDLAAYIRTLAASLNGQPIVLAGYSQGGMLACDTVLHEDVQVQGLALLSACRIASHDWPPRLPQLAGLPVFIAHGMHDAVLSLAAGEALRDAIASGGAQVEWLPFDGGHELPLLVWRRLRNYLRAVAAAHQKSRGVRAIVHTHPQGEGEDG